MIADLIAAADHVGWLLLRRATRPAACGVAIEVPLSKLNVKCVPVWFRPISNGHAARMLTPGAITLGFMIPPLRRLGPRPENAATAVEGRTPNCVPLKIIAASD
ncbi:hypothetical protein IEQ34_005404 [Dendrobium chrysotoxum]|uniref:Uncharacterized protein n=1 Tax=Dendrobium chrysotoxum TaxID=161865 RepID=A0AAV7H819_DENCH|nr:hypothetical protein IEQ34_005404 [Dendrobium chrysotoxum]